MLSDDNVLLALYQFLKLFEFEVILTPKPHGVKYAEMYVIRFN